MDPANWSPESHLAKPKPLSLQRRFMLMQAGAVALALWLVATALLLDLEIQGKFTSSFQHTYASLALNSDVHSTFDRLIQTFWRAYYSQDNEPRAQYEEECRGLHQLTARYAQIPFSSQSRDDIESLGEAEDRFLKLTQQLLAGPKKPETDAKGLADVQQRTRQIQSNLSGIREHELERLAASTAELDRYTSGLYVVLIGFAVFVIAVLISFRYVHRQHLWKPLEQLRQMVQAVRRGNLDVTGTPPPNVELGSLVQAFVDMAADLREMRDSLELKVRERTAKLEAAQDDLLQAAKLSSLGQLVSGVAHEINNPLTSILGFSEMVLARRELPTELRPQLLTIRDESLRLKNLVANLSSFARRAPQHTLRLDLRGVLDRLVDLRHYQLTSNNIQLQYDRPPDPVWVNGDPDQLLQVFLNLMLNAEQAVKACRERGTIALACGLAQGKAWATVQDDGTGMLPEVRDHIFDPFFSTRPVGHGTGLGLSISHGVIKQHGGDIKVESTLGQGTTVRITFPAAVEKAPPAAQAKGKAVSMAGTALEPCRVLIVDDEPHIGEMVAQALGRRGFKTTLLQESTATEKIVEHHNFDLVICDLKMPGKNGVEILQLLREKKPKLARRFLLMTGNLADAEKNSAELAGVPILLKPFTLDQLLEMVQATQKTN